MAKIAMTRTSVTSIRKYPNRATPRSNSVSGGRNFSRSEILPNSASFPVKTTTAVALPLITWVPMNRLLVRLLSGVSTGNRT